MPITGKTTNIRASDLNTLKGVTGQQISLGTTAKTWIGNSANTSLGKHFVDTSSSTQDGSVVNSVSALTSTDSTWYKRGTYTSGDSSAISRDGSTLAVARSGYAVHIYTWNGSSWVFAQKITGHTASPYTAIALNSTGTTLAFSTPYYILSQTPTNIPGRVFVYVKSGSTWSEQATLTPTGYSVQEFNTMGPTAGLYPGSLAFSDDGNTLAVGGPADNGTRAATLITSEGAVYIYLRTGTTWALQKRQTSASRYCSISVSYSQSLGQVVAISADGNTIVAGGPSDSCTIGAVCVFTRSGTTWSQQTRIESDGTTLGHNFGSHVAVSSDGNTMAISSYGAGYTAPGRIYVYTRSGTTWTKQYDTAIGTHLGDANASYPSSLSLSSDGNTMVITASGKLGVYKRVSTTWSFSQLITTTLTQPVTSAGNIWTQITGDASRINVIKGYGNYGEQLTLSLVSGSYTQSVGGFWLQPSTAASKFGNDGVAFSPDGSIVAVGEYNYKPTGSSTLLAKSGSNWIISSTVEGSNTPRGHIAISGDNNTMVSGGYLIANSAGYTVGGAMVFVKNGSGVWSQQTTLSPTGTKLISASTTNFGALNSIGISSDGNTVAIGAQSDSTGNTLAGTAYVYTRSGTTWSQQTRLFGANTVSDYYGSSVSLSSDGNTLAVGAYNQTVGTTTGSGVVRVYTRSGTTWTLQSALPTPVKLGTATLGINFGISVSLSGDGNTIAVGARYDALSGTTTPYVGTVFIYTRSGSTWTQRAAIQPTDYVLNAYFGTSVSLSGDGWKLAVGGPGDNGATGNSTGATWIYRRGNATGTTWTKVSKLAATEANTSYQIGTCVSMSKKGDKLIVSSGTSAPTESVWLYK